MVHLSTTGSAFQARVLAARLGSEGIVVSLRGAVDGPYPFGAVEVEVDERQADLARQLLLADEVEATFADPMWPTPASRLLRPWVAAVAMLFVVVAGSLARLLTL